METRELTVISEGIFKHKRRSREPTGKDEGLKYK